MSGDGTGNGVTVASSPPGQVKGAVVADGTISDFANGFAVGVGGASQPTLNMLAFLNNGAGAGTASINVAQSTITGLQLTQVTADQASGDLALAMDQNLTGPLTITGSSFNGGTLNLTAADNVTLPLKMTNNNFTSVGVNLTKLDGSTIDRNSFTNSEVVITCDADGGDTITGNTFTGGINALTINDMARENITGNNTFKDNRIGILLNLGDGATGNSITGDRFINDGAAGILLNSVTTSALTETISGNTATGNGAAPAGVQDQGGNPVADAIHIYAPNSSITVSNNQTANDAQYGIWSTPGTANGTANTSTGDPNLCNPVNLCTYP